MARDQDTGSPGEGETSSAVGHVVEEAGQIGKAEDLKAVLHLMGGTPDKPPARDVIMDH